MPDKRRFQNEEDEVIPFGEEEGDLDILETDIDENQIEQELNANFFGLDVDGVIDQDGYDDDDLEGEDTMEGEEDLITSTLYDTQHTDGHTYNPEEAWDQGLVYTPPSDPPIIISDDREGIAIGAGFAQSMEASNPDEEVLPARVDNNDEDLAEDVYVALRNNSETANIADLVTITVVDGVVTLEGVVPTDNDIFMADEIIGDLPGVVDVDNRLEVEDLEEGAV